MARKQLIIFDWNGTLQDDLHYIYDCGVRRIFRHFNLTCPDMESYRRQVAADFMGSFYWPNGIPADVTAMDLNAIMKAGIRENSSQPALFPYARETIVRLSDLQVALAVVSGFDTDILLEAIHRNCLAEHLIEVHGSADSKAPVFAGVIDRFGCRPDEVACIGDTVEDAQAAAEVGALPLAVTNGFHYRERLEAAKPTVPGMIIIDSLSDVLSHLD